MRTNMRLIIAMGADFNYADKVETLIKSIMKHNSSCDFYLLNQDYPQEWFRFLNKHLERFDSKIYDAKVTNQSVHDYQTLEHINYAAYLRYFIPDLIKEDKVLYLDTDIVITGSLLSLFQTDITDYALAAVRDVWLKHQFNSGVMLINSLFWRRENLTQKLLDKSTQMISQTSNGDQEILNLLLSQKWLELGTENNAQVGMNIVLQPANMPGVIYHPIPLVVHYASDQKPWILYTSTPLRELWWDYYALDWAEIPSPKFKPKQLFCLTNSDALEQIERLLEELPDYEIHIAAYAFMSPRLKSLITYPNCRLHNIVLATIVEDLIQDMDAYLDINYGSEVDNIISRSIEAGKPIFAFSETAHHQDKMIQQFEVSNVQDMIKQIRCLGNTK